MGPYSGGAEWTLTKDEIPSWFFRVNMMESLCVQPSLSIQMSYSSGLIESVPNNFMKKSTFDFSQRNSSTGRKQSEILVMPDFLRAIAPCCFRPLGKF